MKLNNFSKLVVSIIIPLSAGLVGSIFTVSSISGWYSHLVKPSFNPPNWIFGPVWTTLYFMMGIALFLVWRGVWDKNKKKAVTIFSIQLFLNLIWSILFFGLHNPFLGLIDIVLLWISILWTVLSFHKISKAAALLLLPYLLWVSFASVLNYSVWMLN